LCQFEKPTTICGGFLGKLFPVAHAPARSQRSAAGQWPGAPRANGAHKKAALEGRLIWSFANWRFYKRLQGEAFDVVILNHAQIIAQWPAGAKNVEKSRITPVNRISRRLIGCNRRLRTE